MLYVRTSFEGRRPGLYDLRCGHARTRVARRPRFGSERRIHKTVDPARRVARFTGREATRIALFDRRVKMVRVAVPSDPLHNALHAPRAFARFAVSGLRRRVPKSLELVRGAARGARRDRRGAAVAEAADSCTTKE